MSFTPTRTRPDVFVEPAQGKLTYRIHPKVNPVRHRPLAKFTITQRWLDLAGDLETSPNGSMRRPTPIPGHPMYGTLEKAQKFALMVFCPSLGSFLNWPRPMVNPSYVNPECTVNLLYPADDGRLNFEGRYSDGELLVTGCVDACLISDLTWALCPVDRWAHIRSRV